LRQSSSQNVDGLYIQVGMVGYSGESEDKEKLTKILNHIQSFNGRPDFENPYNSNDEKGKYNHYH
jgi:hypothetical protein